MAVSHITKVYGVNDARISKLLTDPAGGSPTYGASIDVPGIKTVQISGNIDIKELRGDNQLLDKNGILKDIQIAVTNAKMSLDVLAAFFAATIVDTGTTPNQIATLDILGASQPQYFRLEAKTPVSGADTPTGDVHFTVWKCILSSFPDLGHEEEDYRIVGFNADAVPLLSNNKWLTPVVNETAVANA